MCASSSPCVQVGQNNIEKHVAHELHEMHGVGAGAVCGSAYMHCIEFPWDPRGKRDACMHTNATEHACMKLVCAGVEKSRSRKFGESWDDR